MRTLLFGALISVCATGCSSSRPDPHDAVATVSFWRFSEAEVRAEALRDAAAAIAAGKPYVCEAGTIAICLPGISDKNQKFVRNLPHRLLPSGCTEPTAFRSIAYAGVFNLQIL